MAWRCRSGSQQRDRPGALTSRLWQCQSFFARAAVSVTLLLAHCDRVPPHCYAAVSQKLPNLRILWLCDNPCASHALYRPFVIRMCPALVKLDNTGVSDSMLKVVVHSPDVLITLATSQAWNAVNSPEWLTVWQRQ